MNKPDVNMGTNTYDLTNGKGEKVGQIRIMIRYFELDEKQIPDDHEMTVLAENYSHLYRLEAHRINSMRNYVQAGKIRRVSVRVTSEDEVGVDFEKEEQYKKLGTSKGWRRPSRPALPGLRGELINVIIKEQEDDESEHLPDLEDSARSSGRESSGRLADEVKAKRDAMLEKLRKTRVENLKGAGAGWKRRTTRRSHQGQDQVNTVGRMTKWGGSGKLRAPTLLSPSSESFTRKLMSVGAGGGSNKSDSRKKGTLDDIISAARDEVEEESCRDVVVGDGKKDNDNGDDDKDYGSKSGDATDGPGKSADDWDNAVADCDALLYKRDGREPFFTGFSENKLGNAHH